MPVMVHGEVGLWAATAASPSVLQCLGLSVVLAGRPLRASRRFFIKPQGPLSALAGNVIRIYGAAGDA